jgi:hypothetical protein
MRSITMLVAAALLAGVVVATWAMTQGFADPQGSVSAAPGMIDPMDLMRNTNGLPVQSGFDFV